MASKLPYFRWYPADAEGDDFYASLSQEERGVYHTCLNRSWLNDGIPSDLELLARICRLPLSKFKKIWARVGEKFQTSERDSNKLVNKRQEEEREHASYKSQSNQRIGNANASRTRSEKNAKGSQHARVRAESDSVSDSSLVQGGAGGSVLRPPRTELVIAEPVRFSEWWGIWSAKRGTAHQNYACTTWLSVVTPELAQDVIECTVSYLASGKCDDGGGYNPQNFLVEMARDGFRARWPPRPRPNGKESLTDRTMALMKRRIANGEQPL